MPFAARLRGIAHLFYAGRKQGSDLRSKNMNRLTARLLLLVALVGNFVPLVLAATTNSVPACCRRKSVHHCHGAQNSESQSISVHSRDCCNHDCCRAVTTAQWAHAPRQSARFSANLIARCLSEIDPLVPKAAAVVFHSPRAPPAHPSIA